jgi:hypothetical protein
MEVTFELTRSDYAAFLRFALGHDRAYRNALRRARSVLLTTLAGIFGMIATFIWAMARDSQDGVRVGTAPVLMLGVLGFMAFSTLRRYATGFERELEKHNDRVVAQEDIAVDLGPQRIVLDDDGVTIVTTGGTSLRSWSAGVDSIAETPDHILLYITSSAGYPIPRRSFASSAEAHEFAAEARRRLAAAGGPASAKGLREWVATRGGICLECGYDLAALCGTRCPECGLRLSLSDLRDQPGQKRPG